MLNLGYSEEKIKPMKTLLKNLQLLAPNCSYLRAKN